MNKMNTHYLTKAAMLLALVVVFQNLRLIPIIGNTPLSLYLIGSLVNMALILTCEFTGFWAALAISVLSALIALFQGHIPFAPLMPMVALGNTALVASYLLIKNFNRYIALVVGAVVKWGVLYFGVVWILQSFIKPNIAPQQFNKVFALLSVSFNFPQVITAIVGGAIAIYIAHYISRIEKTAIRDDSSAG